MARPDYELQSIRDGVIISSNGTEYTINILWNNTGGGTDMFFGSSGVQISYETPDDKDKNSYILSSKCTIPFLVQNATDKAFILSLATSYQEKDVWITVRKTSNADVLLWCGYVLLDLKDEEDVSYPYEVTLTAVDGLAALKDKPFVRETNLATSATPKFPYVTGDTFYNAGFSNIIGGGSTVKWLPELLLNTGMVLADDDAGGVYLTNYGIQTAVNLYNEGHPAPAEDIDPLRYTQIDIKKLYSLDDDGYVNPPNCYDTLEYICKTFGMRCVYWEHTYHFIEIDQYNTDEAAAGTAAVPINIPTRTYYYTGGFKANQDYIGSTGLTPYDLTLENVSAPGEGLQKLAGTIYSGLPAIKTVRGTYFGNVGTNVYRGFPTFPPTWSTSGSEVAYNRFPYDASGAEVWSTIENAADGDGFKFETYLSFKNTASVNLSIRVLFLLVARESGQTAPSGGNPYKVCKRSISTNEYVWDDWTSGVQPFTGTSALLRYARQGLSIPPSPIVDTTVGILAYSTGQDPYCVTHDGLFPTDAAFTGSWDFTPLTLTCYDSNAASPMRGFDGTQAGGSPLNYGSSYNHGQCMNFASGTGTNYAGTVLTTVGTSQDKWDYAYHYENTINSNNGGSLPFMGALQLSSDAGLVAIIFEVDVVSQNSYVYDAKSYFWGDGETVKVSDDGSTYVFADADGTWVKPTYVWNAGTSTFDYTVGSYNKQLVELNLRDIIYNQSIALKQFNGTTALAETNKFYTGTILKYMNPIGKLTDLDSNQYQLMRGTFNLLLDEWNVTMNQIFYEVPSDTINVGEKQVAAELINESP